LGPRHGHSRKPPKPDFAIGQEITEAVHAVVRSIAEHWIEIDEV
jgi:hypothetical protein